MSLEDTDALIDDDQEFVLDETLEDDEEEAALAFLPQRDRVKMRKQENNTKRRIKKNAEQHLQ